MKNCQYIFSSIFILFIFENSLFSQNELSNPSIHKDSSIIKTWANNCNIKPGFVDISDTSLGKVQSTMPENALGVADNKVVSLGDGGEVVVEFNQVIHDVQGPDFAIFENSFNGTFLELAFVEVSTDSAHFYRFPAISNTDTNEQTGSFGLTDPSGLRNLAGIHKMYFGTAFDLSSLHDSLQEKLDSVHFIRIIDVVGSIDPEYASYDSRGWKINDPWPTPFSSSGFDLDAVALLQPSASNHEAIYARENRYFKVYPNPARDYIHVSSPAQHQIQSIQAFNFSGVLCYQEMQVSGHRKINVSHWSTGYYLLKLTFHDGLTKHCSLYKK